MSEIGFKPRLDLVLAAQLYETVTEDRVTGDVNNPIIEEVGSQRAVPNYIKIVRGNEAHPDIMEQGTYFFTGKALEVEYRGEYYLLVKNEHIFAQDELATT